MEWKLRKWQDSDLDSLVKHANNYNIAKYLTDQFPHPYNIEDAKNYLSLIRDNNPTNVFAIEVDEEAAGSIGIFPQTDIHCKNAELGYWLSEEHWGKGIMPEAIKQIVDYGFKTFDITRIFARPFSTNRQSQRVLEKAGFKLEGKFEKVLFKNGEYLDEFIFAIRK
ncbi:RimJ/RimL family protein N-acetyltransferase [Dysgonomonas alginatilytica]|uniref:RimJ/RimL family protein N-acetyltransferase n=1 Tax=Dysgonomonas alginatilytica TaxID=1605892 RepID=A0A2V3PSJ7_9BACT|nr:GNAT family protein [Dysgonomonas alginatilytica]PXV66759.1 RimJ/RimL family protein N-acetyltransferase [Dysgonomonas alginatilytica]